MLPDSRACAIAAAMVTSSSLPGPRARPARSHPVGQRRAVRQPQRTVQPSKLAVWWLRLGTGIERIKPGHPQQNGSRAHALDAKEESNPACWHEQPAATGALRCIRERVQPGGAAQSAGDENACVDVRLRRGATRARPTSAIRCNREVALTACGRICMYRKRINCHTC